MSTTTDLPELTAKLNSSSHGLELIGAPLLLGLGTHWLESRLLGTSPVITVIVVVLVSAVSVYRMYLRYCEEMAKASLERKTSVPGTGTPSARSESEMAA